MSRIDPNRDIQRLEERIQRLESEISPADQGKGAIGEYLQILSRSWQGPVPSPGDIKAYNECSPELGTSLAQEFLKQGEHRRTLERRLSEVDIELA